MDHVRLVVDNSGRVRVKKRGRNRNAPLFALAEKPVTVALGDGVVDAPVGNGGLSDPAAHGPDTLGSTKCDDQAGNVFNNRIIHHESGYSPNSLDASNVISLGHTFYRNRAILRTMREMVRDVDSISGRIVHLRAVRNWTPRDAYDACGIGKTTWNNYEKGVSRPSLDHAAAICEVFGVTLDWIYTGNTAGLSQNAHSQLYGQQA